MDDLTIIYYTANLADASLMKAVQKQLCAASGGSPIVSVSQKKMDFGTNVCVGHLGQHVWNIYYQQLCGARAAKTKYVACAEDDILYPFEHFNTELPTDGAFLYDTSRYLLFTWKDAMFSRKGRIINGMMLCERELLIDALEERFERYRTPESIDIKLFGEIGRNERELGVTQRKVERFECSIPSIMINHEATISFATMGKGKASGADPTPTLPYWGHAKEVLDYVHCK